MLGTLIALASAILTFIGNIYAKLWSGRQTAALLLGAIGFYVAGSIVFPFALRHGTLTVLNTFGAVLTVIVTNVVALLWFKESLSAVQAVGMAFGVLAILLLAWPK